MLKAAPGSFRGRPPVPQVLNPLAALTGAIFFDLTERRFKSYEVLKQIRG